MFVFKEYCKHGHLLAETRRQRKNGMYYCIVCRRRCSTETYGRNKIKYLQQRKLTHTLRTYGITSEKFAEMLHNQEYKCAICFTTQPKSKVLNVDHCHTTGKIRGLLCRKCNLALGGFSDNIEILKQAIKYVEKYT